MRSRVFWGITFVAIGILIWLNKFGYFKFDLERDWPIFVILLGIYLVISGLASKRYSIIVYRGDKSSEKAPAEAEKSSDAEGSDAEDDVSR